jgi:Zn-dependent protease
MQESASVMSQAIMVMVPMVLSLTVHEYAHAWTARRLGDDTAAQMGRLTLNPLAHADLIGTFVLPMLALTVGHGMPFFGWAKPVPINPARFVRRISMRTGTMLTAAAGPISNLLLAFAVVAAKAVLLRGGLMNEASIPIFALLEYMFYINVTLAVFNLLPIFPLDGQKVLAGVLPRAAAMQFDKISYQFGMWGLVALLLVGGRFLATPVGWLARALHMAVGL